MCHSFDQLSFYLYICKNIFFTEYEVLALEFSL